MDYEVGDRVRCVDAEGLHEPTIRKGHVYVVNTPGTYIIGLEGVVSLQYTWRFARVLPEANIPRARRDLPVSRNPVLTE